ncbi:MAG: coproporphyrinogen dehydrogenase HemZ, partial [Ruminococcaceae bacterium]|nr:coproporphyrinogen dehydrogenase HemZ [Oscillospiraceae bacterium]
MIQEDNRKLPWGRLTGIRPVKRANVFLSQGYSPQQAEELFHREFGADEARSKRAVEIAVRENELLRLAYPDGIGLYIGIPFCPSRCVYCSFISFSVEKSAQLMKPYLAALEKEIRAGAEIVKNLGKRIETVYIGGGTPTTLTADELNRLFEVLHQAFDLSHMKEFTVEAGRPDTIGADKLWVMKQWGVTRISLNPQSMNQEILDKIGRRHSPQDIISAFHLARERGFTHINMDVIAGLPDETYPQFCHTLEELFQLNPEGITVHTMSLKRAAVLTQNVGEYDLTAQETVGKMLDFAWEQLGLREYHPYYLYRQKNI